MAKPRCIIGLYQEKEVTEEAVGQQGNQVSRENQG